MDMKKVKKYSRIYNAMKKCDDKAKELRKKLEKMTDPLIDDFMEDEVTKVNLDAGDVVTLHKKLWAKVLIKDDNDKSDKKAVVKALRAAALHDLIIQEGFNAQSLSAYLRELDRGNEPLPESFKNVIIANPKYTLIVKRL